MLSKSAVLAASPVFQVLFLESALQMSCDADTDTLLRNTCFSPDFTALQNPKLMPFLNEVLLIAVIPPALLF